VTIVFENKWETFESFDFSNIITDQDQNLAIADIEKIIGEGKYFTNSPRYQTKDNLFGHTDEHWMKFRMSFIYSCFMYLKKEVKITNMQAWCFMTSSKIHENREALWHTHQYDNERTLSGIYYLRIPDDVQDKNQCGTEFAINGVDEPERWIAPVKDYHWLIYPGKTYHRPMPPQSEKYRFVLAADMCF
jgi:hypothetical protein